MTVDGVTFVEEVCKEMTKEEFIKAHIGHFWLDRDEATREKMLAEVYSRITKRPKKK